jgi:hypothetical protein
VGGFYIMEIRKSLRDIVMFGSLNYGDPFWFCDKLYIKAEPWENEDGEHVNTGIDVSNGKASIFLSDQRVEIAHVHAQEV